jgi:cell division protein FtsI/penicillin-binding protein 2
LPLVLTIDERIQFVMELELAQAVQRAWQDCVAMNPVAGQIYGMVSYPTFDPDRSRVRARSGEPLQPRSVGSVRAGISIR